jgi:glycosyltransferase involved in cell wall biosynthesis
MVTGAYYPEISGAGLQCRALVAKLKTRVAFTILTTTADKSLPAVDVHDGVPVNRIYVDPASWLSKAMSAVRFTLVFLRNSSRFSIVHFHGFSQKTILLMPLARLRGKRIAVKLTSIGHDDPAAMRGRGRLAFWWYSRSDLFFAVSPRFEQSYEAAGLSPGRLRLIPNGVDCERFRPARAGERDAVRRGLRLPAESSIILFVGFFSHEKRPDMLFEAWAAIADSFGGSSLLFIGATHSPYYEVDQALATHIRQRAEALGLLDRVRFVERADDIERFHRAADLFVLPSVREGMPNALLEAMASATPCIATRLDGVTDAVIENDRNGLLVAPNDVGDLTESLRRCLHDPSWARTLGVHARRTVEERYSLDRAARQYLDAYTDLESGRECAA